MDKKEQEEFIYDITLLYDYMEETLSPGIAAYDVLSETKYEGDAAYQLSLGFLNLATQSYLAAKRLAHERDLEVPEVSPFFTTFKDYKFQLKQYISEKDDNPSWIGSRRDQFVEGCNSAMKFISDYIKTINEMRANK